MRALSAALDLTGATRDAFVGSARAPAHATRGRRTEQPSALPLPLTVLLGREADLQTLRQWLADPAARLITLIGPGRRREDAPGAGARARDRGRRRDPRGVRAAGRRFGIRRSSRRRSPRRSGWRTSPRVDLPRRARVACDGSPHAAGARQLRAGPGRGAARRGSPDVGRDRSGCWSPAARRSVCAASASTSSDRSRWTRTRRRLSPADLARSPAVRLFVERVRDVQPEFRLTLRERSDRDGDLSAARRAAARARAGGAVDEGADRRGSAPPARRDDVLLSTAGPRDLPERQQTMNATVAWSYQLLDAGRAARVPPPRRAAGPFSDRRGRGGACRS